MMPFARILKFFRSLSRLRRGREFDLELAFVGTDSVDQDALASVLLRSERRGLNLLHFESFGTGSPAGATPGMRTALPALYFTDRPHGRTRRWNLHFVSAHEKSPGPETMERPWTRVVDAVVLCWPAELLADTTPAATDMRLRLTGLLGMATAQGPVRRAAVIVTGISPEEAPRHECQAFLCWGPRQTLRRAVHESMEAAAGRPGEALADPLMRSFLATKVLTDRSLEALYESMRCCLGRCGPLFLSPAKSVSSAGLAPLLDWLDRGTAETEVSHSAGFLRRAAWGIAGCGAILLAICLYPLPSGRGSSVASGDYGRNRDPRSGPHVDSIRVAIDERAAAYERIDVRLASALGAWTDPPGLPKLKATSLALEAESHRLGLVQMQQQGLDSLATSSEDSDRGQLADSLLRRLSEEARLLRIWNARAAEAGLDPQESFPWSAEVDRTTLLALLLSIESGSGGAKSDEPGRFHATARTDSVLACRRDSLGRRDVVLVLETLSRQTDLQTLQTMLSRISSSPKWQGIWPSFARALPRTDERSILDRIAGLTVEKLLDQREMVARQLAQIVHLASNSPGSNETIRTLGQRAFTMQHQVDAALAPQDLIVRFVLPGQISWHVDISRSGIDGFEPARWLDPQGGWETGCEILLGRFRVGQVVHLCLNPCTADHVTPGAATGPCRGSTRCTGISLNRPSGTIRVPGFLGVIEYQVTYGWPKWPAQEAS